MKIVKEYTLKDGTKITEYEAPDTSRPHYNEYCVMDPETAKYKFCVTGFDKESFKNLIIFNS